MMVVHNEDRDTFPSDEAWMRHALSLAEQAKSAGEVPVGALLVKENEILAEGWNCPITTHDPAAHAEIIVLRKAGIRLANYRLIETTLYVTLEPCIMCMGAIVHARVKRLVFGAPDVVRGAAVSVLQLADAPFLNHKIEIKGNVLSEMCSSMLKTFFYERREKKTVEQ